MKESKFNQLKNTILWKETVFFEDVDLGYDSWLNRRWEFTKHAFVIGFVVNAEKQACRQISVFTVSVKGGKVAAKKLKIGKYGIKMIFGE